MSEEVKGFDTAEDDFEDFGAFEPSRLSDRSESRDKTDEDDKPDEEGAHDEAPTRPPRNILKEYSATPSVVGQMARHPGSVKLGPPVTETLIVSESAGLKRLNDIQADAHNNGDPLRQIVDCERVFFQGAWYVYITHAQILYQRL